jgi:hypothetical protein
MNSEITDFIKALKYTPQGPLFNPWYTRDQRNDGTPEAPAIRRHQLQTYLEDRYQTARFICIGEALGYQGGHFTGIAMTSERILLGHQESGHGIPSDVVFRSAEPRRTSDSDVQEKGFSEPTATIMWKALLELDIDPFEVILWNALPWHPYDEEQGILSNRTPTAGEFEKGMPLLESFLEIFGDRHIIAVGRKSEKHLQDLSIPFTQVRHPAHGGAPKFRRQMREMADSD